MTREQFCVVPWTHEGYHEVRVFDGGDLSRAERDSICGALSTAVRAAETVAALTTALARTLIERGLTIEVIDPDEDGDPTRPRISVLVLSPRLK